MNFQQNPMGQMQNTNVPVNSNSTMTTAQLQQQYHQQMKMQAYVAKQEHGKKELEATRKEEGFSLIYNVDGNNPVSNLSTVNAPESDEKLIEVKEILHNKFNETNDKTLKNNFPTSSASQIQIPTITISTPSESSTSSNDKVKQSSEKNATTKNVNDKKQNHEHRKSHRLSSHGHRLSSHGHRLSSHGHRLSSHRLSKHRHSRSSVDEKRQHHRSHLGSSSKAEESDKEHSEKATKSLNVSSHEHRKSRRVSRLRDSERRHSHHHRPKSHHYGNESIASAESHTTDGNKSKSEGDVKFPPRYSSHVNPDNVNINIYNYNKKFIYCKYNFIFY